MRRGALLVNTSRGALIDAEAVVDALKDGQLGGLAIDVYEQEADLFFEYLTREDRPRRHGLQRLADVSKRVGDGAPRPSSRRRRSRAIAEDDDIGQHSAGVRTRRRN